MPNRGIDLYQSSNKGWAVEQEALDRLGGTAGPAARKMLERFLQQAKEAEAKYLEEESNESDASEPMLVRSR